MASTFDIPEDHNPADDHYGAQEIACGRCGISLGEDVPRPYFCKGCLDAITERAATHGQFRGLALELARGKAS